MFDDGPWCMPLKSEVVDAPRDGTQNVEAVLPEHGRCKALPTSLSLSQGWLHAPPRLGKMAMCLIEAHADYAQVRAAMHG